METKINTEAYDHLGERWYTAFDDPIALLRAQSRLRNPWIIEKIAAEFGAALPRQILDIGCGAGFLANELAKVPHHVTGIDLSLGALEVARKHDVTGTVQYLTADAEVLPFEARRFDVVCAMDFLEHVESPAKLIQEISRVLKPGGIFFFHTFNRNPVSGLLAIKALEWFIRGTPKNMHLYRLFIQPQELTRYCKAADIEVQQFIGLTPDVGALLRLEKLPLLLGALRKRQIPEHFEFKMSQSLTVGYSGFARRN